MDCPGAPFGGLMLFQPWARVSSLQTGRASPLRKENKSTEYNFGCATPCADASLRAPWVGWCLKPSCLDAVGGVA
eukprot:8761798-Pyramimonas_sp.AAC.1